MDRVSRVFFALTNAEKTLEIAETEKKVTPMLTELENEMSFNKDLFLRIKQVYDNELDSLQGEDRKLTEEIYKDFVRSGALLPEEKMERMKEQSLREAMKPTPELIKRLGNPYGAPCDNEDCPAYDGLTGQCEINYNCHLAR